MKNILVILVLMTIRFSTAQTELYSKAYGDEKNPAIIFLHGGPGYNCVTFEISTAEKLADEGYYVIVYDQRGCGRNLTDSTAKYSFVEAVEDLDNIYKKYDKETATLIGHSFGGTLGIYYAEKYPEKVSNLILTGSPLSYQMTFKNILARCKKNYTEKSPDKVKYIELVEKMDTASLTYSSFCFMHAMQCGLYTPKNPSAESKVIYDSLKKSPLISYAGKMTMEPTSGFYRNEHYITLELASRLKEIKKKINIYGIYGKEDGLFDDKQLGMLKTIIGAANFTEVGNASHNIFIDEQKIFIDSVKKYSQKK